MLESTTNPTTRDRACSLLSHGRWLSRGIVLPAAIGLLACGANAAGIAVVEKGLSRAEIFAPTDPKASPAEVHAGKELQLWIQNITGTPLSLLPPAGPGDDTIKVKIHVGVEGSSQFPKDVKAIGGTDGFAVRTLVKGGITHVYLFGTRPRGVLHAVYALLHRNSDIIFARPDPVGTVFGATDTLVLNQADFLDVPDTATRCYQWTFHSGRNFENEWQSRNLLNRTQREPGGIYDSCMRRDGFGHGVKHFADGKNNFATHPEWFTAAKDGTRKASHPNLCFLAYDMIQAYVSNICTYITGKYKGVPNDQVRIDYFNLSCDDSWQTCLCPKCTVEFTCENGKKLAPTDPAFRSSQYYTWLNKVAREVRRIYPNVTVGTYAYFFTLEPPPFPLEKNILIEFCPYAVDDKKSIADDRSNADLHRLAEGWGKASANTYCRSYWGWGAEFPRPIEYAMSSNVAYFASLPHPFRHYSCEFPIDKDWPDCKNAEATWDVSAMSAWIVTRLWWNSKSDVDQLRADYCRRAFREGGKEMLAYYDLIRDAFFSDDIPSYYTGFSPIPYAARYILGKGLEKRLRGHLTAAHEAAQHPNSKELITRHLTRFDAWIEAARNSKTVTLKVPFSDEKDLANAFDSNVWDKFKDEVSLVTVGSAKTPKYNTTVKLLHDRENLFVRVDCYDPDAMNLVPRQPEDQASETLPRGDSIELFVADGQTGAYRQLFFDIGNGGDREGDMIFDANGADTSWNGKWTRKTKRYDDRWVAIVRFPFSDAGIHAAQTGQVLFQAIRMKYYNDDGKNAPFANLKHREVSSIGGGRSKELQTFAELELELN